MLVAEASLRGVEAAGIREQPPALLQGLPCAQVAGCAPAASRAQPVRLVGLCKACEHPWARHVTLDQGKWVIHVCKKGQLVCCQVSSCPAQLQFEAMHPKQVEDLLRMHEACPLRSSTCWLLTAF